jgi:hypothetical protein
MKPIMSEQKQKFISTLIVSVGAFIGFEALSITLDLYQLRHYASLAVYIYIFHVLWLTFLFDLHFKKTSVVGAYLSGELSGNLVWQAIKQRVSYMMQWHYFRHYQNFLVLPGIIYWTTVCLLFLNPFREDIKQLIVVTSSLSMTIAYWYFKDFFSRQLETHEFGLRMLALVKLLAAFFAFASALGISSYFGLGSELMALAVFSMTFFLIYQVLFQHKLLDFNAHIWMLAISTVVSAAAFWVYAYWGAAYLTGALVVLAVYNVMWGLLHHHLDKNLTKKIVIEYILMTMVLLSLLIGSHDFMPRIN